MTPFMLAKGKPYEQFRENTARAVVDAFVKHWLGEEIPANAEDFLLITASGQDRHWTINICRDTGWWRIKSSNPSTTYESYGMISLGAYLFGVSPAIIEQDLAIALGGSYELAP